jgi:uncharacterized membrane protein HdeD (DUF308 family)
MSTQPLTREIKKRSGWSIFMAVMTAALGLLLIAYPTATAAVATVLFGWVLIFVGLAQLVFALHSHAVGKFFLKALSSLAYVLFGCALAFFPIAGMEVLTAVLGTLLLIQAILQAVTAFHLKPASGWGWYLADSAANLVLGILIIAQWPSSSLWAIGTLVGVSIFIHGIFRIMIAAKIRQGADYVDRIARVA